MTRSPAIAVTLALGIWLSSAAPAWACSCIRAGDVTERSLRGTVVFRGEAVSQSFGPSEITAETDGMALPFSIPLLDNVETTFSPTRIYHADPKTLPGAFPDTLGVWHSADTAMCGVDYTVGQSYFVIASRPDGGAWKTSICAPFTETSAISDLQKATPLAQPLRRTQDGAWERP